MSGTLIAAKLKGPQALFRGKLQILPGHVAFSLSSIMFKCHIQGVVSLSRLRMHFFKLLNFCFAQAHYI